ncbi:MAG: sigma factor-like helix-turn-helix DNA-binding protein [Lachnospiraceae bacterium]|nr:sigma factor-like helix-turn-helix DNA-binding protein [Lachnospiraceae bacterium]
MKINYTFANGETSEVEVTEEIGNVILDSRREESNLDRKERYHCYSMDAAEFEGAEYADKDTPEVLLEQMLDNQHIAELLEELPEIQRRRLLLYTEGKSMREIARMEGVDHKAVKKSIEAAKKYFFKNF